MIKQDIKDDHGVCVIDPHRSLIDDTLSLPPPERAEDVIHFDPSDDERPDGPQPSCGKDRSKKTLLSPPPLST